MKKNNKIHSTLLLIAAVGLSGQSSAFIDPEEWKMDKWGNWDEWDGPPDMRNWRRDQWGDLDQWGMFPDSDRRLPWEVRSGSMPWQRDGRSWGGIPWGNRGNWNSMPWDNYRGGPNTMPWGGGYPGWGGGYPPPNWGGAPYGYAPHGWEAPAQPAPQKNRYPSRPKRDKATAPTVSK